MNITTGKIPSAKKLLIYGPEGVGKSTLASMFPSPVFIDIEDSTKDMDVSRLPKPSSWMMLLETVAYVWSNPNICKTLVIDTADWAERLCVSHVCAAHQTDSIAKVLGGYSKGFEVLAEEFGRLLNLLTDVAERDVHVVLTAHANVRKFEQPDEMAAYDRWGLKLTNTKAGNGTASITKEWADAVLFSTYKTFAVKNGTKTSKGQGGKHVLYTAHHPAYDAKNRWGLPSEIDIEDIAELPKEIAEAIAFEPVLKNQAGTPVSAHEEVPVAAPVAAPATSDDAPSVESIAAELLGDAAHERLSDVPSHLAKLYDLIRDSGVTISDVQEAVAFKGYYPKGTPVEKYDAGFVEGALVAAWPSVLGIIADIKKVPF